VRARSQAIVVVAVFVATIAVAANVFAHTFAAEQYAEGNRIAAEAAWAQPLASSTTTTQAATPPESDTGATSTPLTGEPSTEPSDDGASEPAGSDNKCKDREEDSDDFRNHGCEVSSFASDPDFKDGIEGPPGAVISEIARPDVQSDGPPRADRAEENRDRNVPPGEDSDNEKTPPGQDKKNKDG
jgi:hypothetical protein